MKATKDFKTVNQKFKAGDDLPDDIDTVKWSEFVAHDPVAPAETPAEPPFKF
jgi:hypothetical protein